MLGKWNSTGLSILRNMNSQYAMINKSMERISSGYRINRAGDDPAGLAISEKMRAQIQGAWTGFEEYPRWNFPCPNCRRCAE